MEVSQFCVIHAKEVKHGRVKVVDADAVFHGLVADFIRLAVTHTAFDARARHPGHETIRVVVAAAIALGDGHTAELTAPDYQGAVPETAPFQIGEQAVNGHVG